MINDFILELPLPITLKSLKEFEHSVKNSKNHKFYSNQGIYIFSNSFLISNDYHAFDCHDGNDEHIIAEIYNKDPDNFFFNISTFDGCYSFILIDVDKQTVMAASDDFHHRPLYYQVTSSRLVFSSDIEKLIENKKYAIDTSVFFDYLVCGMPRKGMTIYKNISIIPNGELLTIKNSKLEFCKIDKFPPPKTNYIKNPYLGIRKIFNKIIKNYINKTGRDIGITLSGGLDSSAIVCVANKYKTHNHFTHSFIYEGLTKKQELSSNEIEFMNSVIESNDVNPIFHTFKENGPLKIIDEIANFPEPIVSPNIYAHLSVFKNLKLNNINFLFEGVGGDNIISHGHLRFFELGKKLKICSLFREYKTFCKKNNKKFSYLFSIKNFILKPYLPFITSTYYKYKNDYNFYNIDKLMYEKHKINVDERFEEIHGYNRHYVSFISNSIKKIDRLKSEDGTEAYVNRLSYNISKKYNVEILSPFYSKELSRFTQEVPLSEKMKLGIDRYYFREGLKEFLPSKIYKRTSKGDMSGIFFNELKKLEFREVENLIFKDNDFFIKYFDPKKIKILHSKMHIENDQRLGVAIYKLIYLASWLRKRKDMLF